MKLKPLTISSLGFLIPAILGCHNLYYCLSISTLILTSLANHHFDSYKKLDCIYTQLIVSYYTFDALINNYFEICLCTLMAFVLYATKKNRVNYHLFMHLFGIIGLSIYSLKI